MATQCVNLSLKPPIEYEGGQVASNVFQVFGMTRPGIEHLAGAFGYFNTQTGKSQFC